MKSLIVRTFEEMYSLGDRYENQPTSMLDRFFRGFFGSGATLLCVAITLSLIYLFVKTVLHYPLEVLLITAGVLVVFSPLFLGACLYAYRGIKGYERVYIGADGADLIRRDNMTVEEAAELAQQQIELEEEKAFEKSAGSSNAAIDFLQGALIFFAFCILMYQCYGFLQYGAWPALPLDNYLQGMGGKIGAWYDDPESWVGLHGIIKWLTEDIGLAGAACIAAWIVGSARE
jgi:hypothetical protein